MNAFRALAYLETHRAANFIRGIRRQPGRMVVWFLLILWLSSQLLLRSLARHGRHADRTLAQPMHDPFATLFGLVVLVFLFGTFSAGASGFVGGFSGAAEARFLTMSALPERMVVLWLQIRNSLFTLVRLGFAILIYALLFTRSHMAGAIFAMAGAALLGAMLPLPAFEASRKIGRAPTRAIAYALSAIAFASAATVALALLFAPLAPISQAIQNVGFGRAAEALWIGNPLALACLYAGVVLVLLMATATASDIYPELYAASMKFTARLRRRRTSFLNLQPKAGVASAASHSTALHGVWVELWKQRTTWMRSPNSRILFFIELAIVTIGGIIGGFIGRHDAALLVGLSSSVGFLVILILAFTGTSLAVDLSKPLWWMGRGSTFARLCVWTWATSLDASIVLGFGVLILAISSQRLHATLGIGIPMALIVPPMLRSIGVATYAFFPAAIDQRGPLAVFRMLAIYLCMLPPIATGLTAGLVLHSFTTGAVIATITIVLEAAFCVFIAAWRIEGRGYEFALAEH